MLCVVFEVLDYLGAQTRKYFKFACGIGQFWDTEVTEDTQRSQRFEN